MTDKPLFSVIVPTYNRAALIGETLDSFVRQAFADFEVIVVDDGSTDNTEAVMAGWLDSGQPDPLLQKGKRGARRCPQFWRRQG